MRKAGLWGGSVPAQLEGGRADSELRLTPVSQGPWEGVRVAWEDPSPPVHQETGLQPEASLGPWPTCVSSLHVNVWGTLLVGG